MATRYDHVPVTKPTDLIFVREIWITASGKDTFLRERNKSFLREYHPTAATQGTPKYWAEESETQWRFAPTPNNTDNWTAHYHKRPDGLSSGTLTTFLSDAAPDALFFACLAMSEAFLIDDTRVAQWIAQYGSLLPGVQTELRRLTREDYTPLDVVAQVKDED